MFVCNFETTLEDGTAYSLKKYAGKPIIIVDVTTRCGLTPQFKQLEEFYQACQIQGLVTLGLPSNQSKQEPDSATKAAEACKTTYGVAFLMHQLIDVNGENTDPLSTYLKNEAPDTVTKAIKWSLTKSLIDRNDKVIERFAPQASSLKITVTIEFVP